MSTLRTERLLLRQLREDDLDGYAAMCGDPKVMRYIGDGKTLSRAEAWRHLAMVLGHWQLRGYGLWAVEEQASGRFVGRIGCWKPEGWPEFEVGWMLRPEFWGRGYATEGARAALRFAFEELRQPHVISLIHPDNTASIRVAERLGETLDAAVDALELMGHQLLVYRIKREEWARRVAEPRTQ
jgi:RimJ/RimL family protein N-acetyltransferase